MNFDLFWSFIDENASFFDKLAYIACVKIDYNGKKYYIGENWNADPVYLFLYLFRRKFDDMPPSLDHEFTRMNKMLYANGIKLPFGKKEYDEYVNYENINQRILSILETVIGAKNGKFIVPTKEYSNKMFKEVSRDMETILSGIFIYEEREARYYVDIYDRLTGFEVFLDSGTIFVPVKFMDIKRSAFMEDRLRSIDTLETVIVSEIQDSMSSDSDNKIYIAEEFPDSIYNVAKYFNSFMIDSDDIDFCISMIDSINRLSDSDPVITIGSEFAPSFMASIIIDMYLRHGSSSISRIIDIARVASTMNNINRSIVIDAISVDISGDIVELLKPYIEGSNDDYIARITELVSNRNIEFTSRIIRLNGDNSSIRFYNKEMKYYKDFNVDKNGIMNELVPELGGFRFIASYCGINNDNIPSGFNTVESFILYAILKVVHAEFASLPVFDRFYGSGIHKMGEKVVFNSKHGVYGLGGRHSFGGVLFNPSDIDVRLPKTRPTKNSASSVIKELEEKMSGFVSTADKRHTLSAILLASSSVVPILSRANKPIVAIYGAGLYTRDGLRQRIFNGCFRNSNVVNTESDFVLKTIADGSTSFIVSDLNRFTQKTLKKLASERFGTETVNRFKNTDSTVKTINTAPIFVFSEDPWLIEESIVFNFPARVSSEAGSFLYDTDDISSILISYCMNNHKKIVAIEDKFVQKIRKKLNLKNMSSKHPYVDFFEKILAGMCLVESTGFIDGWDFHDMMYEAFFNGDNIYNAMNIEKLLLSLQNGSSKIEDKLFDETLRMNQNGDIVAVDKVFHATYVDKEDTDNFILIFKKRDVYNIVKEDINMSFTEFSMFIDGLKNAILIDNAMRNYKLGHDKTKTIYNWYNELFGKDKDNFAAIKISKKRFYKV